jgi:hypothetical protein
MLFEESAAQDRLAAEMELDDALDSGDLARIETAQAEHNETVAAYNEAVMADRRMAQAEAEQAAAAERQADHQMEAG